MLANLDIPAINSLLWNYDTNDVANKLISTITNALNAVAPFRKIQTRNIYAVYLSKNTKELMKNRNDLKDNYNKSKCQEDLKTYRRARNHVLSVQRKEKASWAAKMIGNNPNDSKKLWKTIKCISGDNKNGGINKLIVHGVQLNTPKQIATGLNNYFTDKIIDIKKKMPDPDSDLLAALETSEAPKIKPQESIELTEKELKYL